MAGAFDDLSFLMASENRLAVLTAIADAPLDRDRLVETTGTSSVTVGRITDDLLEHNWIERHGDAYRTTMLGDIVAEDAAALERTVSVARRFRCVPDLFDAADLDFDLRLLEHASVSVGPEDTAFDHVDRWSELFRRTDHFKGITSHIPTTLVELLNEEMLEHDMTVEGIYTADLIDRLDDDPEKCAAIRTGIEAGSPTYCDEDGDWDMAIGIYDDAAMSFVGFDEHGTPRVKIESSHPALLDWAIGRFETIRERATPLTAEQLSV